MGADGSLLPFWVPTLCHLPGLPQDPGWYQGTPEVISVIFRWKNEGPRGLPTSWSSQVQLGPCKPPLPCRPAGQVACAQHSPLLSHRSTRPTGVQVSPHRVSMQQGLSARGLVWAMKPAQPHSCGWSRASHCTGTHCTDTEPSLHTQDWQLLTHRSPGCNRPGQGPPGLLGGAPASGAASSSGSGPNPQHAGSALSLPLSGAGVCR